MSAATFLCALAVALIAGGAGFAYGFFTGCRYGGFPASGGQVPKPKQDRMDVVRFGYRPDCRIDPDKLDAYLKKTGDRAVQEDRS